MLLTASVSNKSRFYPFSIMKDNTCSFLSFCFKKSCYVLCLLLLLLVPELSVAQAAMLRDVAKPLSTHHKPLKQPRARYTTCSSSTKTSRKNRKKYYTASVRKTSSVSQADTYYSAPEPKKKRNKGKKTITTPAISRPSFNTDDDFVSKTDLKSACDEDEEEDDDDDDYFVNTADLKVGCDADEEDDVDRNANFKPSCGDADDNQKKNDDFCNDNNLRIADEVATPSIKQDSIDAGDVSLNHPPVFSESVATCSSASMKEARLYATDSLSNNSFSPADNKIFRESAKCAADVFKNARGRQAPASAHNIRPEYVYGKGTGYGYPGRATVALPDGSMSTYNGDVPLNKIPVVVHAGRPDNGSEWGKHIEYRDVPPLSKQLNTNDKIELGMAAGGMAVGLAQMSGDYYKQAEQSWEKGEYKDAAQNVAKSAAASAAAGAVAVGAIYALLKFITPSNN